MEILKVVILGVVEGITEWLPVSSTGHMIILDELIHLNQSPSFVNVFLVVIQLGAILAVILLFWDTLWPFQKKGREGTFIRKDRMILWGKIVVACLPAAVAGILFDQVFERLFYHAVPVMAGASLLRILQYGFRFTGTELAVLAVGMLTAFVMSVVVIRFLMEFIKKHDFRVFGWYRILLGGIVLLLYAAGVIQV